MIRLFGVLGATLVLASCSTTVTSELVRSDYAKPTEFHLNHYVISLFKGEKEPIEVEFTPCQALGTKMNYVSDNPSVASVDSKGVVTAKKAGEAQITVSCESADGKPLSKKVDVIVTEKISETKIRQAALNQQAFQNNITVDKYTNNAIHYSYTYEGDSETPGNTPLRGYKDDCITTVSTPDGFLQIDGYQTDTKAKDGSPEPTKYAWTFYCDSNYDSWLFHETSSVKHWTSIPTQAYIGKDRIQPVYDIANSLFGNLVDIVKRGFSDALESDYLEDAADGAVENCGVAGDNILRFKYGGSIRGKISADEEDNLHIHADTTYTGFIEYDLTFVNGVVKSSVMRQVMYYKDIVDGIDYTWDVLYEDEYFINEDSTFTVPNVNDYNPVDSAFDL